VFRTIGDGTGEKLWGIEEVRVRRTGGGRQGD
jgi:hypothetical protein